MSKEPYEGFTKLFHVEARCYKCGEIAGYLVSEKDLDFEQIMTTLRIFPCCTYCRNNKMLIFGDAEKIK